MSHALMHPDVTSCDLWLTQDIGPNLQLRVTISQYKPLPGEITAYIWADGQKRMDMPPYCIKNVAEVERDMDTYIKESYSPILLDENNSIIRDLLRMALRSKVGCPQT